MNTISDRMYYLGCSAAIIGYARILPTGFGKLMVSRIILLIVAAILNMLLATNLIAEGTSEIEEDSTFIIPIDHPKILTPSEFVKLGRPIRTLAPAIYTKEFRMAFSKRPNILSCLSSNQPDENFIDLSLFLWQELSSPEEARVCLFYVADILGEPGKMFRWLTAQGFGVDVLTNYGLSRSWPTDAQLNASDRLRLYATDELQRGRNINFWVKQLRNLSRSLFGVPEWRLFDYHGGVSVSYRDRDKIYGVNLNYTGK